MFTKVKNLKIHYRYIKTDSFYKGTIVLIHGWAQSLETWTNVSTQLAELDYDVLVYDLPGFGQSDPPNEIWQVADFSKHLKSFLTQQKIENPLLLGHSFGARIALHFASENEAKQVLVYSSEAGLPSKSIKKAIYKRVLLRFFKGIFPRRLFLHQLNYSRLSQHDIKDVSSDRAKVMLDIYAQDFVFAEDVYTKITCPVDILVGENDLICSIELGSMLTNKISNSRLHVVSDAAHLAHIENEREFFDILKKILV